MPPSPPAPPPPTEVDRILDGAKPKVSSNDFATAAREIARARVLAKEDSDELFKVAYAEATLNAYKSEYESAGQALLDYLKQVGPHPESPREFQVHNCLMMLRAAHGDIASAIVELDEQTLSGQRGTWVQSGGEPREQMTRLKDAWHKAYYFRMLAQRLTGNRRDAAIAYAEAARRSYTDFAKALPDHQDSIAVLDAYFAALDGDKERALAGARRVDVTKNGDLEDLYLVFIGFEAGGDTASAENVRKRMKANAEDVYLAAPIMLRWVENDVRARTGAKRFTPLHPTASP